MRRTAVGEDRGVKAPSGVSEDQRVWQRGSRIKQAIPRSSGRAGAAGAMTAETLRRQGDADVHRSVTLHTQAAGCRSADAAALSGGGEVRIPDRPGEGRPSIRAKRTPAKGPERALRDS